MQPNILMIMVDQQRYDCIGYSNDYPVQTPNIDRLAREGVWFSRAYSHIPLCCPARQSFLNGQRPETFGGLWNYDLGSQVPALEPESFSWVRELQKKDYNTGYVGKWHVHPDYDPTHYGFDQFIGCDEYDRFRKHYYPQVEYRNGFFGEIDPIPLKDTRTHWFAGKTIQMMQKYSKRGEPWHIRLDFPEPHLPCTPTASFMQLYDSNTIPIWHNFNETFKNKPYIQQQQLYNWNVEEYTWHDWSSIVARYYAIISQVDDAIGRIMDELDRQGWSNNTMVIFTADHGDMCGAHRMMDKHFVMYEDIVKVPLAIRWPGYIDEKQVCDSFVYNLLDLSPTILEVADIEVDEPLQGESLLPLITGQHVDNWRTEVVSTYNGQQFGLFSQRMIRTERWKYVWNATDLDELYDLDHDPGELSNVISNVEYADISMELRRKLYTILKKEGDTLMNNEWLEHQFLSDAKIKKVTNAPDNRSQGEMEESK